MTITGLLFFPITPFGDHGVDTVALSAHVSERIDDGASCVFAACGTGEFHALGIDEHRKITGVTVRAAAGRVPVFVGVGGSLQTARELAIAARSEGASGILLMPPYLVKASQRGLIDYIRAIVAATDLDVIVYQRGEMRFTPESAVEISRMPNVIGLKDGVGDISNMQLIVTAVRSSGNDDFLFFNGLPTAELTMRAYRAVGVPLYSSAVFAFAPDIALDFHRALERDDDERIEQLLRQFFIPFVSLRDRQEGYQVSLVKAAVVANGKSVGGVRPPLVDPTIADREALTELVAQTRVWLARNPAPAAPAIAI